MRAAITIATVAQRGGAGTAQVPVLAVCFGVQAEPVSLAAQERALRIEADGLLAHAEMLAWERTGDFGAHGAATKHLARMQELMKGAAHG